MDEVGAAQPEPPREDWRESVRQGMLTSVPWFAAPVVLVALIFRGPAATHVDEARALMDSAGVRYRLG